ncbi:MAG: HEAT repeat domain-containing protein, partial [Deltaproteobacteria bacterium]|nr:HEAT repeat domain-containing protein [Deltaproteobacteria bacterium]
MTLVWLIALAFTTIPLLALADNASSEFDKHIAELKSIDQRTQREAARALGKLKDAKAVPYLAEMMHDPEHNVALMAGCSIGVRAEWH